MVKFRSDCDINIWIKFELNYFKARWQWDVSVTDDQIAYDTFLPFKERGGVCDKEKVNHQKI